MNSAVTPSISPVQSDVVLQTVRSLRKAFQYVLILLIILSSSLFTFLLREVSTVRRQTAELSRVVADYQHVDLPLLEDFRKKLGDYTRAHPDFGPIMAKYFVATNAPLPNAPALLPLQQHLPK